MSESYYNTTHVRGVKLRRYELAAEVQEEKCVEFWNANPYARLTAEDVGELILPGTPRTSWGRCLTNLTTRGYLVKTDEQVEGVWGRPIYIFERAQQDPQQGMLL